MALIVAIVTAILMRIFVKPIYSLRFSVSPLRVQLNRDTIKFLCA